MHRLVQFHAIARPLSVVRDNRAPWNGESPENGNLPIDLLRALCGVLGEHTCTPDRCWFCLYCTLVAGSESLAQALLADPRFEAWRVDPGDPVTYDSDQINT
jgi:hypothetical protein